MCGRLRGGWGSVRTAWGCDDRELCAVWPSLAAEAAGQWQWLCCASSTSLSTDAPSDTCVCACPVLTTTLHAGPPPARGGEKVPAPLTVLMMPSSSLASVVLASTRSVSPLRRGRGDGQGDRVQPGDGRVYAVSSAHVPRPCASAACADAASQSQHSSSCLMPPSQLPLFRPGSDRPEKAPAKRAVNPQHVSRERLVSQTPARAIHSFVVHVRLR
jgi:hypothetical protein